MSQETYKVSSNPVIEGGKPAHLRVLFAGESQTKPLHRLGPKVYDFYLMHIVLEGRGTFNCGGQTYQLQAGHTFLIEPEQLISYESDEECPWRYRWVAFHGEDAAQLVAEAGFHTEQQVVFAADKRRQGALFLRIYESFRQGGQAADLRAIGYMHLLLAEYQTLLSGNEFSLRTSQADGDLLLQQVVHYLSTQYANPISIEQMAESFGYNRAYLSRLFKQQTGLSPVAFLLKLRIDKGRQLLRDRPELTTQQIAASVGLQDALYFSKQFRRLHGLSPTAYRATIKQLGES